MYQYEFFDKKLFPGTPERQGAVPADFIPAEDIAFIRSSYWAEHCMECGEPECYTTCSLFAKRSDDRCRRFAYGIHQNMNFSDFPYQADIQFKRWGKLESITYPGSLSLREALEANKTWALESALRSKRMKGPLNLRRYPIKERQEFDSSKYGYAQQAGAREITTPEFLLQLYSYHESPFTLLLEITADTVPVFKESLLVIPGFNQFVVPVISVFSQSGTLRTRLYPENDLEVRVVLLFCEYVSFVPTSKMTADEKTTSVKNATGIYCEAGGGPAIDSAAETPTENTACTPGGKTVQSGEAATPAEKLKCVAWDLDNTVWDGILIEADPNSLALKPQVLNTMQALDERGIIQISLSKNSREEAEEVLTRLGIEELFVAHYINWEPKSANLRAAAKDLNINLDTFALIDDSPFERSEVSTSLPQVRVYSEQIFLSDDSGESELLELPELEVVVTADAKERRSRYRTETQRKHSSTAQGSDHLAFLKDCELTIRLEHPNTEEKALRSFDLLQRTNQLNLSGTRPAKGAFERLLQEQQENCFVVFCQDRFGSYGQVAFIKAQLDCEDTLLDITEFAMSCRVAGKYVESAVIKALIEHFGAETVKTIRLSGKQTGRNALLVSSFVTAGFTNKSTENTLILILENPDDLLYSHLVSKAEGSI